MKFKVKVHPNSSQEKICRISENEIEVWIKEKPVDGRANVSLFRVLKKCFGKEKNIKIVSGFNSRIKLVDVFD